MTPLQNDPQQHQREAKNLEVRVPCGGKRSQDSESLRRELSKSGLASHVGPQKCDFAGRGGGPLPEVLTVPSGIRASEVGGTTAGAQSRTRVWPSRIQCTTEEVSRVPIASSVGGKIKRKTTPAVAARSAATRRRRGCCWCCVFRCCAITKIHTLQRISMDFSGFLPPRGAGGAGPHWRLHRDPAGTQIQHHTGPWGESTSSTMRHCSIALLLYVKFPGALRGTRPHPW
jgi:hypothetical protein